MTEFEELWSEINDLPGALLVLANGGTFDEFIELFYDPSFDSRDYASEKRRARKALQQLVDGRKDDVGRAAVKELLKSETPFETHLDWDNGLTLRSSGTLETPSLRLGVTYAIARTADKCSRSTKLVVRCGLCGNFALKDKRGSGNRNNNQWCSARCKDRNAQQKKRERDKKDG